MQAEYDTLWSFPAFKKVPRPADRRVLQGKWVYKRKLRPDGQIAKYKARYVARGFTQRKGVDFHETFSPVVSAPALRAIIALASRHRWRVRQHDVTLAYLNALLRIILHMEQMGGFADDSGDQVRVVLQC